MTSLESFLKVLLIGAVSLLISILGNFLADTLHKNIVDFIRNGKAVKQMIVFSTCFVILEGFMNDEQRSPLNTFLLTCALYITYLLFSYNYVTITGISFLLTIITYILVRLKNYYGYEMIPIVILQISIPLLLAIGSITLFYNEKKKSC